MRRWGDEISSAPVGSVHEDADRLCQDATEQVDDQEREEKRPAEDDRGLEDPGPALGPGMRAHALASSSGDASPGTRDGSATTSRSSPPLARISTVAPMDPARSRMSRRAAAGRT